VGDIRVVLADDCALVRQGTRRFLEESGDISVVAEHARVKVRNRFLIRSRQFIYQRDAELVWPVQVQRAVPERQPSEDRQVAPMVRLSGTEASEVGADI